MMPNLADLRSGARTVFAVMLLTSLGACATLPSSGPTAAEIRRGAKVERNGLRFQLVDIDGATVKSIEERNAAADAARPTLADLMATGRVDVVGPGDVLSIGIYEVGVSLFGSGRDNGTAYDPSARGEYFPNVVVDGEGTIALPYAGRLVVRGLTTAEIQQLIQRALAGKSQSPQAIVALKTNISSTVYVGGDVRHPGRFELTLQRERLLDAIALGGGATYSSEDTIVRFNRGNRTLEERLGRIRAGAPDDLSLVPGDRIELIKRPRSFIVLGATARVAQIPFETGDLSLAEAVARAGGPNDAQADPKAIFLFRFDGTGQDEVPVIYRLNLMQPSSYFLSQRFAIRDKDVIYIANAASMRPSKLVSIFNQFVSPVVTAKVLTQ